MLGAPQRQVEDRVPRAIGENPEDFAEAQCAGDAADECGADGLARDLEHSAFGGSFSDVRFAFDRVGDGRTVGRLLEKMFIRVSSRLGEHVAGRALGREPVHADSEVVLDGGPESAVDNQVEAGAFEESPRHRAVKAGERDARLVLR